MAATSLGAATTQAADAPLPSGSYRIDVHCHIVPEFYRRSRRGPAT
ncbi:hypothetical protein AB0N07_00440 [Streptomyces sp. NPDC051172]